MAQAAYPPSRPPKAFLKLATVYHERAAGERPKARPPRWTGPRKAAGVSAAELIREPIDRAIGGNPGSDLAAIDGFFGILAREDAFARGRDERTGYLDRLAGA